MISGGQGRSAGDVAWSAWVVVACIVGAVLVAVAWAAMAYATAYDIWLHLVEVRSC